MAFQNLTLQTSSTKQAYANKSQDIQNINLLLKPYGLEVNETNESAQVVRYIINLPLDVAKQSKIRRATKDIEYALSSALGTDEFTFKHSGNSLVIERRGKFNVVKFGDLYTSRFLKRTSGLALMLGKDMDGKPVYTNLEKAPHILVAGTTGSGKSETLHSIIASLLMTFNYRPNCPMGIMIIDMKGTEYNKYKDANPITIVKDENKAYDALESLCALMDNRYSILAKAGCDDIDEYVSMGNEMIRVVCIIDELADLMLQNRDVEKYIVRLAQKARACGIHLIIATQSPRADVVTGLIKANIPFKIALNTSTALESRIILDENGAEKLLGKGDMLIKKGGNKPIHAQGCYVDDLDKEALNNISNYGYHCEFPSLAAERAKKNTTTTPIEPQQKKPGFFKKLRALYDAPQITGRIYH